MIAFNTIKWELLPKGASLRDYVMNLICFFLSLIGLVKTSTVCLSVLVSSQCRTELLSIYVSHSPWRILITRSKQDFKGITCIMTNIRSRKTLERNVSQIGLLRSVSVSMMKGIGGERGSALKIHKWHLNWNEPKLPRTSVSQVEAY